MLTRNRRSQKGALRGTWKLQDAKARFSELVRRARLEGPQRVTVHGKDAVVVVATHEYDKSSAPRQDGVTGSVFVEAMQQARKLGLRLKPLRYYPTYRPPLTFEGDDR
jgi:prevent-host-death family protein